MTPRASHNTLLRLALLLVLLGIPVGGYGLFTLLSSSGASGTAARAAAVAPRRSTVTVVSTPNPDYLSNAQYAIMSRYLRSIVWHSNPRSALMELATLIARQRGVERSCHALAHDIGHAAYARYHDFPTALEYQDDVCGSGYIHGVIESRFAAVSDITTELQTICTPYGSGVMAGKCYHGVGHGIMKFTRNDLPRSLNFCDAYMSGFVKIRCSEGVFMENFNTDRKVHPSRFLNAQNPLYPCPIQPAFYKGTCYYYAPIFYLSLHRSDYREALQWCDGAEAAYISTCVTGVGSRIMKENISRPRHVEALCDAAGASKVDACIDGMVSYYLVNFNSYSKGQALCAMVRPSDAPACAGALAKRQKLFSN